MKTRLGCEVNEKVKFSQPVCSSICRVPIKAINDWPGKGARAKKQPGEGEEDGSKSHGEDHEDIRRRAFWTLRSFMAVR